MEESNSTASGVGVIIFVVLYLGIIGLALASWWKVYEKAGKPGWAALVPIYGTIVLIQIIGKPGWWVLMFFIPIVNIVFLIWAINLLSKSFGKEEGYTLGLIFLGIVFLPMLAFGDATYTGPAGDPDFQFARNTYAPAVAENKDLYNSTN